MIHMKMDSIQAHSIRIAPDFTLVSVTLTLVLVFFYFGSTITQADSIKKIATLTVCYMFIFPNWMRYTQLFSYVFM